MKVDTTLHVPHELENIVILIAEWKKLMGKNIGDDQVQMPTKQTEGAMPIMRRKTTRQKTQKCGEAETYNTCGINEALKIDVCVQEEHIIGEEGEKKTCGLDK